MKESGFRVNMVSRSERRGRKCRMLGFANEMQKKKKILIGGRFKFIKSTQCLDIGSIDVMISLSALFDRISDVVHQEV